MSYQALYITGGAYDTIVVEREEDNEIHFVTALTVDRQEINDFLAPEPEWDNWHGDDNEPEGGYEHYYGGVVIAMRRDTAPPTIFSQDKWLSRLDFYNRDTR